MAIQKFYHISSTTSCATKRATAIKPLVIFFLTNFFLVAAQKSPLEILSQSKIEHCQQLNLVKEQFGACLTQACSDRTDDEFLQTQCYNKQLSPASINSSLLYNFTTPYFMNKISIAILPYMLKEVDEREQRVALELLVIAGWRDPRLSWLDTTNPDPNTNDSETNVPRPPQAISLPFERVWHPRITFLSGFHDFSMHLNELVPPPTSTVTIQGVVFTWWTYIDSTYCGFNSEDFPFESTVCNIHICPLENFYSIVDTQAANIVDTINECKIDLNPLVDGITDYSNVNESCFVLDVTLKTDRILGEHRNLRTGEWQLDWPAPTYYNGTFQIPATLNYTRNTTQNVVEFSFRLVRSSYQHCIMWIAIPGCLSVLSTLVLLLVCDATERYTFGASIILTLVLMQVNLVDTLVPSQQQAPTILWYYTALEGLVFASCVAASLLDVVGQWLGVQQKCVTCCSKDAGKNSNITAAVAAAAAAVNGLWWCIPAGYRTGGLAGIRRIAILIALRLVTLAVFLFCHVHVMILLGNVKKIGNIDY